MPEARALSSDFEAALTPQPAAAAPFKASGIGKLEADSILDFFLGLLSLGHISMGLVGFMHNKERQLWVILFKECVVTEVVVGRELSKTRAGSSPVEVRLQVVFLVWWRPW